ncbi:MAG TPA: FtsX-like permease family protein, partial [Gemmataceae bacterium]|nr:FtsX-like permease family protein [Gemmataceae bacterium]
MLAIFRTVGLRYLRSRWFRVLLVTFSISLGVATWVATGLLNASLEKSIESAASPLGGVADLYVTSGEIWVPRSLVDEIAKVPGVKTVQPLIYEPVQVLLPNGGAKHAILLGMSREAQQSEETARWGITVTRDLNLNLLGQGLLSVVIDRKFAFLGAGLSSNLPKDASELTIRAGGTLHKVAKAGTVNAVGPAATLGGFVIFMECEDAARLVKKPGRASRLDVVLETGQDLDQAKERIQAAIHNASHQSAILGGQIKVQTPQAREEQVRDVLIGVQVGFLICGAGALVVGMFLVYNALAVSVTERSHDIGILRSLGATRGQIRTLFLGEAAFLGAFGALLGVPLGLGIGYLLLGQMEKVVTDIFMPLPSHDLVVSRSNIIAGMIAGLITSLIAAWIPSAQAASQEPADAVRRVPPSPGLFHRLLQVSACVLLVLVGTLAIYFKNRLPERWGAYGGLVLIFLAAILATPLMVALAARLLRPIARHLLGLEGRLAADNLIRSPGRTGLVIACLAASVALLVQTAGVIRSNEETLSDWLDHTVVPDLIVSSGGAFTASGQSMPMDPDLGRRLVEELKTPQTQAAPVCFRYIPWNSDGKETSLLLIGLDAATYYQANSLRKSPIPFLDLFRALSTEPGTTVVSNNFADIHKKKVGDSITVPSMEGPLTLKIIGAIEDYSWNRGTIFVHRSFYEKALDLHLVDLYHVYLTPGISAEEVEETRERLQKSSLGAEHSLFALTRFELRDQILDMVRRLYGLAYRQLAVVAIVASLGVLSALMISVIQRQRELGLLRAVGAN